jgi:hypothetical protein
MVKKLLIILSIIAIVFSSVLLIFYFRHKELIDYIDKGSKSEHRIFISPNKINKLTLYVFIKGDLSHYDSFIYIVEGEYEKTALPENRNFIKFPKGAAVSVMWENDNLCKVISDNEPVINNLKPQKFAVELIVDKEKIRLLSEEGKVYR